MDRLITKEQKQIEQIQKCLCGCVKLLVNHCLKSVPKDQIREELRKLEEKYPSIMTSEWYRHN